MNKVEEILKLVLQIVDAVGVGGAIGLVVAAGAIIIVPNWLRERRMEKAYGVALDAKEREIQRLADDNRTLRRSLFLKLGYSMSDLEAIEASSVPTSPMPSPTKVPVQQPAKPNRTKK